MSGSYGAVVIEDDPDLRMLIRASLEFFAGWRVVMESAGAPGIEAVRRERPDVVVVDYMLPEMNGLEVCRRLKADSATADLPVVILTGRTNLDPDEARAAGAEGVLTKPFDPEELPSAILELTGAGDAGADGGPDPD